VGYYIQKMKIEPVVEASLFQPAQRHAAQRASGAVLENDLWPLLRSFHQPGTMLLVGEGNPCHESK
jgi:hypothetical protein